MLHRSIWIPVFVLLLARCGGSGLPEPGSDDYLEAVSAFYNGVAAMEVGEELRAEAKLTLVTDLAPDEPTAWANRALLALRRNEFAEAREHLATALEKNDSSSPVLQLAAAAAFVEGRTDAGVKYLRRAVASDSTNVKAVYALFSALEGEGDEAMRLLAQLDVLVPGNMVVLLDQAQQAVNQGGITDALLEAMNTRTIWGEQVAGQLEALRAATESNDPRGVTMQLAFLRNVLLSEPVYRQDLATLRVPIEQVGDPLTHFERLAMPVATPSPPDVEMEFVMERFVSTAMPPQSWISTIALGNDALPAIFFADADSLRTLREEAWASPQAAGIHAAVGIDYDFDFRMDLVLAGARGLRLVRQDSTEQFADVTATLGLAPAVTNARYSGVWVADVDLEGDVDLVLGVPGGAVRTLRNNGDGSFTPATWFPEVPDLTGFVWADLDSDGDPDAVMIDGKGQLHIMGNERQGRFIPIPVPAETSAALAITATDSNSDGKMDLLVLRQDGEVWRFTLGHPMTLERLVSWNAPEPEAQLHVADLDNNGGVDLIVATPTQAHIWLQNEAYAFQALPQAIPIHVFALSAIRDAGQLDLIGLDSEQQPARVAVYPTMNYHWKQIRPRAAQAVGDQRINSFGIGGEVELRAGLLYQKQRITQPVVHFGLGNNALADVARITWPNGSVQAEFDLLSDQVVSAQQRLKGSCPWLFTWNGDRMVFVTDFIWRSPLGLRINAQETAGIMTTEDWVKIRGDQLQPKDGRYDVRITGELWETHFFDYVALMVVDHPVGTEIYVDERFAFPPPELKVHVTGESRPVAGAWDDTGREVTADILAIDERYLDFFGRGDYQGITREHFVEFALQDDMSPESWLLARGWIRPTDSSINVAISHGKHMPPQGLRLDALQPDGTWQTVHANLGFPSGKSKTILIDLQPAFAHGTPSRLRLHTNMEIYWDALHTAPKSSAQPRIERIVPATADLRYRGYSVVREADRSSPELPAYDTLNGTAQIWRDLVGYYTRFGDVNPLLESVDDRYVIMNAGDELALTFGEVEAAAEGWIRDYVLIGDGWVKDGDYNTTFSTTLRPLPAHDQPTYNMPPGALEDDPVYQRYPWDWYEYHTRFVTPGHFSSGISFR